MMQGRHALRKARLHLHFYTSRFFQVPAPAIDPTQIGHTGGKRGSSARSPISYLLAV